MRGRGDDDHGYLPNGETPDPVQNGKSPEGVPPSASRVGHGGHTWTDMLGVGLVLD
jgi:hypothetical protein